MWMPARAMERSPKNGGARRAAPPACAALDAVRAKHQKAIVAHPQRPSAVQLPALSPWHLLPPPFWSVACTMRPDYRKRRLSQGTTTAPRMISQATMNPLAPEPVPRRHARHHANAHPSPDPHRQPHGQRMTLAFIVPHAACVASPRSATVLSSVPPSPLDARALQYPPQYVPRPRRARLRCLLICYYYLLSLPLDHPQQPFSTMHAAAYRLLARPGHPHTHHEHDAHVMYPCAATVFSGVPLSARNQVLSQRVYDAHHLRTLQLSPTTRTTFVPSPRPLTICSSPHHLRVPRTFPPHYPTTTPILSAVPPPDTRTSSPAKSAKMRSRCSSRNYAVRAAAPAAFRERQPTASARGREAATPSRQESAESDVVLLPGPRGACAHYKHGLFPVSAESHSGRLREMDAEEASPPSSFTATDGGGRGTHEAAPITNSGPSGVIGSKSARRRPPTMAYLDATAKAPCSERARGRGGAGEAPATNPLDRGYARRRHPP
ncbi:hypothetical protein K438DRAFT_1968066 [Mycena galopus ATCC 62051]|nr:hypothetical protein K438DRAFT_1968066 [Mycena galopus ATCC 62051]